MLQLAGRHIGDCWTFVAGEVCHLYFLECDASVPRHLAWDIGHATSRDLVNWEYRGVVVRRGAPDAWDGICPATGSVLARNGRYWMAYTGNWFGPDPATGIAVSDDLFRWEKLAGNPVTRIDERLYTARSRGRRALPHWRDPFLFEHAGFAYQLTCATARDGRGAAGAIGVARSRDLRRWELRPPLAIDSFSEELECPQIVAGAGRYYLLFSSEPSWLRLGEPESGEPFRGNAYSMVAEAPLGPYRVLDPEPILPTDVEEPAYAARAVRWRSQWFLLGTIWSDTHGDRISDPIAVELTSSGIRRRRCPPSGERR